MAIEGTDSTQTRPIRLGMVGGGQGAFIGRVHCTAAVLDNRAALVAGALSSDPARAKASAPDYDIPPARAYGSYAEMLAAEAKLPADERIDFVTVATPNFTHFEIAAAALPALSAVVAKTSAAAVPATSNGMAFPLRSNAVLPGAGLSFNTGMKN